MFILLTWKQYFLDTLYRVFKEAEENEASIERYKDSKDIAKDLMNLDKFDEVDVKASMNEWQRLMDAGDEMSLRKAKWLGIKIDGEVREGGRVIQALEEYSRNTPEGQLRTAQESIDKIVNKKSVMAHLKLSIILLVKSIKRISIVMAIPMLFLKEPKNFLAKT